MIIFQSRNCTVSVLVSSYMAGAFYAYITNGVCYAGDAYNLSMNYTGPVDTSFYPNDQGVLVPYYSIDAGNSGNTFSFHGSGSVTGFFDGVTKNVIGKSVGTRSGDTSSEIIVD